MAKKHPANNNPAMPELATYEQAENVQTTQKQEFKMNAINLPKYLLLEYRHIKPKGKTTEWLSIKYMDLNTGYMYPDVFHAYDPKFPIAIETPCLVEMMIIPKPGRDGKMTMELHQLGNVSAQLSLNEVFENVDVNKNPLRAD